jgi:hypothetical protein
MKINQISPEIRVFHDRMFPEEGFIAGYAALINAYNLEVALPEILSFISLKKREYKRDGWQVFTSRHKPSDSVYGHLQFAFKYEGVNLLILKKLFLKINASEIIELISLEPTGQYSRKIWFLYEWLLQTKLELPDLKMGNYVPLINEEIQYAISKGQKLSRYRIINNLPGTIDFCPLIRKTYVLENFINSNLAESKNKFLSSVHKDILQRASAFLMLKDSKASFTIEGESPKNQRAVRWGKAIGQAGTNELSKNELFRLQNVVIENTRFIEMGFRKKGGFVGEHDRISGEPIPDHISAKWKDLDQLISGLLQTNKLLIEDTFDAVLAAAAVSFGFVFIHPFVDGNGRLHRYLIHHVLAKKRFTQQGIVFPVSTAMLNRINDYRICLESFSKPLLDFIEWKETEDHNIEVLNQTIDFYRYFDATAQAEFLYQCVDYTIKSIIPEEIDYLLKFDNFKSFIDNKFEIPDKMVSILLHFLEQNNGKLSKRALEKEFSEFTSEEITEIESKYNVIFKK